MRLMPPTPSHSLFNIENMWDDDLLALFGVPRAGLPEVRTALPNMVLPLKV